MINFDGDDNHDLDEAGPENRGDVDVVGSNIDDNDAEADDDDLDERDDRTEETSGPSKKGKQLNIWPENLTLAI